MELRRPWIEPTVDGERPGRPRAAAGPPLDPMTARMAKALSAERVRQSRELFSGSRGAFDDAALARAALTAMRDASPAVLAPLAALIMEVEREQPASGDLNKRAHLERHAAWIASTWRDMIDAALAEP